MICMYVDVLQPLRTPFMGQDSMYVKAYLYGQTSTNCCAVTGDSLKAEQSTQADVNTETLHNTNTQGTARHDYPPTYPTPPSR